MHTSLALLGPTASSAVCGCCYLRCEANFEEKVAGGEYLSVAPLVNNGGNLPNVSFALPSTHIDARHAVNDSERQARA